MGNQIRNEELLKEISAKLKALRHQKGLSQESVFNDTGIHISRIETSKVNISVSTLHALCKYYCVGLGVFFNDTQTN